MIHVMRILCCLRTDRLEENGNGVPGLELPAPELKNLAQIAKVDCCEYCCSRCIMLLACLLA